MLWNFEYQSIQRSPALRIRYVQYFSRNQGPSGLDRQLAALFELTSSMNRSISDAVFVYCQSRRQTASWTIRGISIDPDRLRCEGYSIKLSKEEENKNSSRVKKSKLGDVLILEAAVAK